MLCAPVKVWRKSAHAQLLEVERVVYDQEGKAIYTDVDWQTKTIVSYHNFDETPDLEGVLKMMQIAHPGAHLYKIATQANSILDSLRMLKFQRSGVIGLCMGKLGQITRICASIFGEPFMYAPETDVEKNAPGQLLASELEMIYHFHQLTPKTRLYGLIGDPIDHSIGHLYHNDRFRQQGIDGVYLKMTVKPGELQQFLRSAQELPFHGLSVTAPLKEAIIPFLDEIDPIAEKIGAVNTVIFHEGKLLGTNTDIAFDIGPAKNVVILGAGGAAKALAYVGLQNGSHVTIVSRTPARGELAAQQLGCCFSSTVPSYDLLINATSASLPIPSTAIIPKKRVIDVSIRETRFLQEARRKKCQNENGLPMYLEQAEAQQKLWNSIKIL